MRIKSLAILLGYSILLLTFVACWDDDEYEYSNEVAIRSFSINNINTQLIEYNEDTQDNDTTNFTVTGSNYKFTINQLPLVGLIYNTDSLPINTDVKKVSINLSIYGSGVSYNLKDSQGNDSLCWWSSSDSLNFTEPIIFKVYATDGIATKDYQVKVNVHKQHPDSLEWSKIENSNFPGDAISGKQKAVNFNNKIFVYADSDPQIKVTYTNVEDGTQWSSLSDITGINSKADYSSVLHFNNKLYIVTEDNILYSSSDGISWESENQALSRLLASFKNKIIGINNDSFIEGTLTNNSFNWEIGNSVPTNFPTGNSSYVRRPLPSNPTEIERVTFMGQTPSVNDTAAIAWNLLSNEKDWIPYVPQDIHYLPNLERLAVISYDEQMYAFGGKNLSNKLKIEAFEFIYFSDDHGKTWNPFKKKVLFPVDLKGKEKDFSYVVDDNNFIWIMFSGEKTVWKGIINRLRISNS